LFESQQRIFNSEIKYFSLFENFADAIFIHDLAGNILEVNQEAVVRYKYTKAELLQMRILDLIIPEQLEFIFSKLELIQVKGAIFYETISEDKNKNYIYVEINAKLIDYSGQKAVISVCRDVSGRKKIEENLRTQLLELKMQNEELRIIQAGLELSRAKYLDLYELAPVGYFTLSEKGHIQETNLTAAALLEIRRDVLGQKLFANYILPADQEIFYKKRKQLYETGLAQMCELHLLKLDQSKIFVRLELTLARNYEGTRICHMVVINIVCEKQE
jgi:PAS domain S-box-containing protein